MGSSDGPELSLYEAFEHSEQILVPYPVVQKFKDLSYEEIKKKYEIVFDNRSMENASGSLEFNIHALEPGKTICATLRTVPYKSGPAFKIFINDSFGDLSDQQRAAVILSFCLFTPGKKPLLDFSPLFGGETRLTEYDNKAISNFVDQLYGVKTALMVQLERGLKL